MEALRLLVIEKLSDELRKETKNVELIDALNRVLGTTLSS